MYELKITNKRENQINELIIRKGGKARKHSICAALGNFVLIVFYRNLSYFDEKMVY